MMSVFQALNICPWRTAEALMYGTIAFFVVLFLLYPIRSFILLPLWAAWPKLRAE